MAVLCLLLSGCARDPNATKLRYLESGDKYMKAGRLREAVIMYRNAVKKDPRFGLAYYRLADASLRQNDFVGATPSLRRAVDLLPDSAEQTDARVKLADLFATYLDTVERQPQLLQELEEQAREILKRDANSYDGHRLRGRWAAADAVSLWERGSRGPAQEQRLTAIAELRVANRLRPGTTAVVVPLARCLWDAGDRRAAEGLLEQHIAANKSSVLAYSDLVRFYSASGRSRDLDRLLTQAERDNPHYVAFAIERAVLYYDLGRAPDSVAVLSELKKRAKDLPDAYHAAAAIYLRVGKPEEAILQYEEGVQAMPRHKLAFRRRIVEILASSGRVAEAIRANDAVLGEYPGDAESLIRHAALLLDRGDVETAASQLELLRRKAPANYSVHYYLGRAFAAQGQREQARLEYAAAIQFGPLFLPARAALAEIQLETDDFGKALVSGETIVAMEPGSLKGHLIRAAAYRGMQKYPEARNAIRELRAIHPNSPDVLFELGQIEEADGRRKAAEDAYQASYSAGPESLRALKAIIALRTAGKEGDSALRLLQQEVAKSPERRDLRVEYADTAQRLGRHEIAGREYEQLLTSYHGDTKAAGALHLRLGEIRRLQGDLASALAHLEKARAALPSSPIVLHNLAIVYESLGRRQQASDLYEASLKRNEDNGIALNNLACYIVDNGGDLDRALTLAQRARQKLPARPEINDTIGWIYYQKDLTDNAIEIFEKLVASYPKQPSFRYHLGAALLKKGQKARAREQLLQALANRPPAGEAGKIKAILER
jgi:tetratricopeptide (TPR) repeat protein